MRFLLLVFMHGPSPVSQWLSGFLAPHWRQKRNSNGKKLPKLFFPPIKFVIKLLQLNAVPSTLALVPHCPSSLTFCSGVARVLFPTEMYARCTANTCRNSQNLEIPTILEDSFKKPKILQPTAAIQLTLQNSILYDSSPLDIQGCALFQNTDNPVSSAMKQSNSSYLSNSSLRPEYFYGETRNTIRFVTTAALTRTARVPAYSSPTWRLNILCSDFAVSDPNTVLVRRNGLAWYSRSCKCADTIREQNLPRAV